MDDLTDHDHLLDMIESITLDVLARIGDDPDARFAFFKRFVTLAKETVQQVESGSVAERH